MSYGSVLSGREHAGNPPPQAGVLWLETPLFNRCAVSLMQFYATLRRIDRFAKVLFKIMITTSWDQHLKREMLVQYD
jgi:hypothetical protein